MSLRQLCNVTYAWLAEDRDGDQLDALDRQLAEPFQHELTPQERKLAEARRRVEQMPGGIAAQEAMVARMGGRR